MRRFHSLTVKLILAFLIVSLTGAVLAAVLARWATARAFDSLVVDQAEANFINDAATYYQVKGSWDGVARSLSQRRLPPGRQPARSFERVRPEQGSNQAPQPFTFVLLNQDRTVVVPAGGYRVGQSVAPGAAARETPIEISGQVVGSVIATGQPVALDQREALYVARTNQALLWAGLIGAAIALVLGAVLARELVHPITEMTAASRAVARGELGRQVTIRSDDELGELAASFNQMSADLAQASALRRQMTADIAHELRSPLSVITGYLESLRDGVLKPNPERFQAMYGEAQQLGRLVEDLRTLSLADAGELPLTRLPVPAGDILEQVVAAFGHQADQAGVRLEAQAANDESIIAVDPERLVQVLENLVSNALRHTPAGGEITLAAGIAPGAVLLCVQDTGEGIPAHILPHIFERFYRGDPARSLDGGESGLGLAIAKSIVEAHGGTLAATSAGPGTGSTFTIRLPA
jgi:signal transduction histidine kinase